MANNKTADNVKRSMAFLYSDILKEREEKKALKEEEKKAKKLEKKESEDDSPKLTKKEKTEAKVAQWHDVLVGLTGDDLEYSSKKKKKQKYKKWIGEEDNVILTEKPKKHKKKNYQKEFAPELNMLKTVVTQQNKFIDDLQRRYNNVMGPNTKDAMPPNKTMVELAAVINNARGNTLGLLREIGSVKKTIAELYMKQKKLEADLNKGYSGDTQDLGLLGSTIFGSSTDTYSFQPTSNPETSTTSDVNVVDNTPVVVPGVVHSFDPSTWDGAGMDVGDTKYENMDKTIVVEYNQEKAIARFKAIDNNTKEEIVGCPVPTCKVESFDIENKLAKDAFDQIYPLEVI